MSTLRINMKPKLNAEQISEIAEYFKVLSEESRLKILNALCHGPKNVGEITELSGLEQANVSRHLKILLQAGILKRRAEGVSAFYEIANKKLFNLCEFVCQELL